MVEHLHEANDGHLRFYNIGGHTFAYQNDNRFPSVPVRHFHQNGKQKMPVKRTEIFA